MTEHEQETAEQNATEDRIMIFTYGEQYTLVTIPSGKALPAGVGRFEFRRDVKGASMKGRKSRNGSVKLQRLSLLMTLAFLLVTGSCSTSLLVDRGVIDNRHAVVSMEEAAAITKRVLESENYYVGSVEINKDTGRGYARALKMTSLSSDCWGPSKDQHTKIWIRKEGLGHKYEVYSYYVINRGTLQGQDWPKRDEGEENKILLLIKAEYLNAPVHFYMVTPRDQQEGEAR